jgi:hypothetical protein
MCLLSYFWESESHLHDLVFGVDLGGGVIDVILCIITLVMLRRELTEHENKKVERMIESGALIVAILVLVTIFGIERLATLQETRIRNELISLDWKKQRIYAFEATAKILVRPLQPVEGFEKLPQVPFLPTIPFGFSTTQTPEKDSSLIFLNLGRSVDMAKGTYSKENAEIQNDEAYKYLAFEINGTNRFIRFDIHFGGHHENFFENRAGNTWEFFNDSLTPEDLDAIDLVLPFRCEIISGEIKMDIDNGLTNMVFQIPKQTTFVCAATSVATNGTFVPLDFSPEIRAEQKMNLK